MADAVGDPAWRDTDIREIEEWISVDDALSDRAWLNEAKSGQTYSFTAQTSRSLSASSIASSTSPS